MLKINIPKGCNRAGKINCFGESVVSEEEETLILPYSVFIMKSKQKDFIELDLLNDNGIDDFSIRAVY